MRAGKVAKGRARFCHKCFAGLTFLALAGFCRGTFRAPAAAFLGARERFAAAAGAGAVTPATAAILPAAAPIFFATLLKMPVG